MVDFSRLMEVVGGFFSAQSEGTGGALGGIAELLAERGLDPNVLEGLSQSEVLSFLAEQGIDLAGLDPQQVDGLLQSLGLEGGVASVLGAAGAGEER